jgi:hypothetical protein
MNNLCTRRGFVAIGSSAVLGALVDRSLNGQAPAAATPAQTPASAPANDRPPPLDPKDVQRFVGVAHRDIDAVRSMLDQQPTLINASWDWTGGDWETAMGAAGHTGRVEIAELLLSRGARIEMHAAAMLGWLDFVKAAVTAQPGAQNILGPHAIPMWSHADTGGEQAAAVLEYLESVNAVRDVIIDEPQREKYVGRYRVENKPDQELVVVKANRRLQLQPPQRRAWYMLHQGDGVFHPADNLTVKLTFDVTGDRVRAMNIDEGNDQAVAVRVD